MRYLFENYTFDPDRRELRRDAEIVPITPQAFDLLDYLIRNRERVVSKDDLIRAIWNGRAVSDAALTTRLNAARDAIGDTGEKRHLIKTLPRKGFRFVGTVFEDQQRAVGSANLATHGGEFGKMPSSAPRLSIVVLPFANLSGDKQQDDFVDAITENLTTDISRLPDYFVISCKTAFAFKGKIVDARQIGRELGVRYVLEGSVQSGTDRLRVNAQLIDAESGAHLWAERFDKPRAAPLDMQDEITARLARAMDIQLMAAETRRLECKEPKELDGVDLALRGWMVFFQKVSVAGAREARSIFEEALRIDKTNVDVLMGLVETHLWEVNAYMSQARAEQVRLAEAAMSQASELTPLTARMHFCRAALLVALRAPEGALREIELAMSLDPDLPYVHVRAGWVKIFLGRGEEAEGHVTTAMRLSPRDPMLGTWYAVLGLADLHLGRLDKAVDRLRKAVDIAPKNELPYFHLAAALALQDSKSEAVQASEVGRRLAPIFRIGKCRVEVQSDNPVFLRQRNRIYEGMERAGVPD
ncbi:winged helix-turn-helix domain-containing protein [uncultured Bradyrhizobium sp.]|uniref:winged helix-turn-helix domain-containing tetratricopeptide repeat protein n=1 Tax=Bradyrhizobium sp. TaxID=376 RepID=UPI00262F5C3E|nr:winged helix-turn-helix domain-containing protein [uncultured Bradyrhizobium sp.]